jgi:hypothetical protein
LDGKWTADDAVILFLFHVALQAAASLEVGTLSSRIRRIAARSPGPIPLTGEE